MDTEEDCGGNESFDPAQAGAVAEEEIKDETEITPDDGIPSVDQAAADSGETKETEAEEAFDPSTAGDTSLTETDPSTDDPFCEIQITPEYLYKNPEKLEFDRRVILKGDGAGELAKALSEQEQKQISEIYLIIYVKEDKMVTEYYCAVAEGQVICREMKPEERLRLMGSQIGSQPETEMSITEYIELAKKKYQLNDENEKEGETK